MAQFNLEIPELPENPTNADLANIAKLTFEAARLTHDCLEQHRKTQEAGNIVISSQITSLSGTVSKLAKVSEDNCTNIGKMAGSVRAISKSVRAINNKAEEAKKLAATAAKAAEEAGNDAASAAISGTEANKKLNNLNDNAWKFVWTIVGGITIAGIVSVCGLAYQAATNHTSTVAAVQSATNTVVRNIP